MSHKLRLLESMLNSTFVLVFTFMSVCMYVKVHTYKHMGMYTYTYTYTYIVRGAKYRGAQVPKGMLHIKLVRVRSSVLACRHMPA
jgi:hypothetical protein